MTEVNRIVGQLKAAYEGPAWHGPSVKEVLAGINAAKAASHPSNGAHSIWELTLHIATWESAALRRLNGDPANIPDEEDWRQSADTGEAAWEDTLGALDSGHNNLIEKISSLTDADLEKTATGQSYNVYVLLHGVIHHNLYHAGQIAILRK